MSQQDAIAVVRREFAEGLPGRLEVIRSTLHGLRGGYDAAEAKAFYMNAHRLKGAAGSFGAEEVAVHASRLTEIGFRWSESGEVDPTEVTSASEVLSLLSAAVDRFGAREGVLLAPDADPAQVSAAARLEVVGVLASLINTTFDLREIFQKAILELRRVMNFRRASVVLLSEDDAHYYLHTLFDADRGGFIEKEGEFPLDNGLPGKVIQTGQAMRVDELSGTDGIRAEGEGGVSTLVVPLHVEGKVIGTLNLGARGSARYDDEDLELAVLLGKQISTSLHYSKLLATIDGQRDALAREHASVRSERTRLEALIEASDAGIMMISDGRVVHLNGTMAQLVGMPSEVLAGAPIGQINRALARCLSDPDALAAQVAVLHQEEGTLRDRVELVFPRRVVCDLTVTVVPDADGSVLGYLVVYRDVTREADAEAAKDEFVSIVSHELRTPLTSVKTSLGLLNKGAAGDTTPEMTELTEIALRNLDRLIRLVDDLLDLSRVESGRVVPEPVPVSLWGAVGRAVEAVDGFAHERGVAIEVAEHEDDVTVRGDADRLEQVMVNLLSNAIKFSPAGGSVRLALESDADTATLEIADEGPGIPPDQLEVVFDKFRQLEMSASRTHGGAGLGLTISRSLVEQFGGTMWAESHEGRGSRFFVRLPLATS